jgi:hypothetical protein
VQSYIAARPRVTVNNYVVSCAITNAGVRVHVLNVGTTTTAALDAFAAAIAAAIERVSKLSRQVGDVAAALEAAAAAAAAAAAKRAKKKEAASAREQSCD